MTRKDYEMVAAVLRAEIEAHDEPGGIAESARTATRRIAGSLADAYAADNPRFNAATFMAAVEPAKPLACEFDLADRYEAPSPFEVVGEAQVYFDANGAGHLAQTGRVVATGGSVIETAVRAPRSLPSMDPGTPGNIHQRGVECGTHHWCEEQTDGVYMTVANDTDRNRLGRDSVIEWDDLSDADAHLDDVGD